MGFPDYFNFIDFIEFIEVQESKELYIIGDSIRLSIKTNIHDLKCDLNGTDIALDLTTKSITPFESTLTEDLISHNEISLLDASGFNKGDVIDINSNFYNIIYSTDTSITIDKIINLNEGDTVRLTDRTCNYTLTKTLDTLGMFYFNFTSPTSNATQKSKIFEVQSSSMLEESHNIKNILYAILGTQ